MGQRSIALTATIPLVALLAACEATDCTRTATDAAETAMVRTSDVERSAVLTATLSTRTGPLPGKTVGFWVDGRMVGEDRTDARGVAMLDLKGRR